MKNAKLVLDGKEFDLPTVVGSESEKAIDARNLRDDASTRIYRPRQIYTGKTLRHLT